MLSLTGSVLAVAVPAFVRNVRASRLAEPLDGLRHIGSAATLLARQKSVAEAYPASAPLTPSEVPAGESVEASGELWQHPTWEALGFRLSHGHYFSFAFESELGDEKSTFIARAHGDLDGDGLLSTFTVSGEAVRGSEPVLYPIEIQREVE